MSLLDIMPINEAIELYYVKHHALRNANLEKLIQIKKECPEIFDIETDAEIRHIIAYAKEFEKTERYKELQKLSLEEQSSLIKSESTEK